MDLLPMSSSETCMGFRTKQQDMRVSEHLYYLCKGLLDYDLDNEAG